MGLLLSLLTNSGAPPFDPTQIAGLAAWYRADKLVTSLAGVVSAWGDSSGNGDANRNAVQANALKQPTLVASSVGFGNQPTIDFSLGLTSVNLTTGTWSAATAQPFTVFMVGKQKTVGTVGLDNIASTALIYDAVGNNTVRLAAPTQTSDSAIVTSPCTIAAVFHGVSSTSSVSAHTQNSVGNCGTNGLTGIVIGNGNAGDGQIYAGWEIAELAIYGAALTGAQIDSLNTYASTRYGITIGA